MTDPIILFDFEYTAWEGSRARKWSEKWEHREIIQIAAIQVEIDREVIETRHFDCLVKPKHNPVLSPYIIALTGIEQSQVDLKGVCFAEAFDGFYAFCEQGRMPLLCYGDDPGVLIENCKLNEMSIAPFPAGIYDIRMIFERAGVDTGPYTSGTVHQAVGAKFNQAAHNALNDVRSLAITLQHLMLTGQLEKGWAEGTKFIGNFQLL